MTSGGRFSPAAQSPAGAPVPLGQDKFRYLFAIGKVSCYFRYRGVGSGPDRQDNYGLFP